MFDYDRFESVRVARGVTKAHIAAAIGRTPTICQDWKKGKSVPNSDQLKIVAAILGTTPEYLTGESDQKEKPAAQSDGRDINDADIMAAFWGDDGDLTGEDVAELWADAKEYIAFKTAQLKKRKQNDRR